MGIGENVTIKKCPVFTNETKPTPFTSNYVRAQLAFAGVGEVGIGLRWFCNQLEKWASLVAQFPFIFFLIFLNACIYYICVAD